MTHLEEQRAHARLILAMVEGCPYRTPPKKAGCGTCDATCHAGYGARRNGKVNVTECSECVVKMLRAPS